jgi:Tfp pilus assembly protein PilF
MSVFVTECFSFQLGVVFLEQGKAPQALAYLDKALEFDPEHEQALLNSAILLQELGRAELRKVARERLLKLLRKVFGVVQNAFEIFQHVMKL